MTRKAHDSEDPIFADWIGTSAQIRRLQRSILNLRGRGIERVLILGERGTGKERVAKAVHEIWGGGSFIAVNCAQFKEKDQLANSELFGYVKGAFTGAVSETRGLIRAADGGTIFLDEIACLPLSVQATLLRVLEGGEVLPVGSCEKVKVNIRLVAATNEDLKRMCSEGQFRGDLLDRLSVIELTVPPLRDRGGDLELLARSFLDEEIGKRLAGDEATNQPQLDLSTEAIRELHEYEWPGNVRELRNAITSWVVERDPNESLADQICRWVESRREPGGAAGAAEKLRIEELRAALVADPTRKILDVFRATGRRAEGTRDALKRIWNDGASKDKEGYRQLLCDFPALADEVQEALSADSARAASGKRREQRPEHEYLVREVIDARAFAAANLTAMEPSAAPAVAQAPSGEGSPVDESLACPEVPRAQGSNVPPSRACGRLRWPRAARSALRRVASVCVVVLVPTLLVAERVELEAQRRADYDWTRELARRAQLGLSTEDMYVLYRVTFADGTVVRNSFRSWRRSFESTIRRYFRGDAEKPDDDSWRFDSAGVRLQVPYEDLRRHSFGAIVDVVEDK